ncbi:hypothetical protein FRC17_000919 [Serendipita sp. 399]|nr:hypothetical protein FRC17_000919 [Serendipita sp. 399]
MTVHWQDIPVFSIAIGAAVAAKGLKDGKLSKDGAFAALCVGVLMLSTSLHVFGITLLVFYFIGSRATQVGKDLKVKFETGDKVGHGQRDAVQLDSLMGATVQQTLYSKDTKRVLTDDGEGIHSAKDVTVISGKNWLSNNQVNLVSSALTAVLISYIGM